MNLKKILSAAAVLGGAAIMSFCSAMVAAAADAGVSVPNAVNGGDTFTVTVTFTDPNVSYIQSGLTYDDSLVDFVGGDATGGGGYLDLKGFAPAAGSGSVTVSLTFKAQAQGSCTMSLTNSAVYSSDGSLIGSPQAWASVTVATNDPQTPTQTTASSETQTSAQTSAQSDTQTQTQTQNTTLAQTTTTAALSQSAPAQGVLLGLTVDKGQLEPAFAWNVYDYTVNVDNSVDRVEIEGVTASPYDYIWYTGEPACAVGENIRTITVTDTAGVSTVYTIHINRAAEGQTVSKQSSAVTKPASSGSATDATEKYREMLNPVLFLVLLVLIIALVIILIWVNKSFSKKQKNKNR